MVATKCIPKYGVCDLLVDWRDFESVCYNIPSRDGKNFIYFFYHFWPILLALFAQMRMFRMFCMLPHPNGHP